MSLCLGLKSHVHEHASLKNSKKESQEKKLESFLNIIAWNSILVLDYLNQRSKNLKNEIKNHMSNNNLILRDDLGT